MSDQEQLDRVTRLFDAWADAGRAEGMEQGHAPSARQAFDRLEVAPGQRYLDVGCGSGYTVRWAAAVDPSVHAVGIDVSAKMIALAREGTEAPNARFIHAPFPLPMLKARAFDAILSMEVFYYLPDLSWGLLSAARLLRPGGLFACVVDYYAENPASHGWPEDVGVPMTLLSEAGWASAMMDVGFEVVEQRRLTSPDREGEPGSLMTLVRRPE